MYYNIAGVFFITLLSRSAATMDILYKPGNLTLGGIFSIHLSTPDMQCGQEMETISLAFAESMIFAIEEINNRTDLLKELTLGYLIEDECDNRIDATKAAFRLATKQATNDDTANRDISDQLCTIRSNNGSKDILAIIGTMKSSTTIAVSPLLQISGTPHISPSATSDELDNSGFKTFFRTIPPDRYQVHAMIDIIDHFDWTYIAVFGVDDSYGRNAVRRLEREIYHRNICIALSELIIVNDIQGKIRKVLVDLKELKRVQVIVLFGSWMEAREVISTASQLGITGRTWLASESFTVAPTLLSEYFDVVGGMLWVTLPKIPLTKYENYLSDISPSNARNLWYKEFWERSLNCTEQEIDACDSKIFSMNLTYSELFWLNTYSPYIPYVIDAVYAVAFAIQELLECKSEFSSQENDCKGVITPDSLNEALRNLTFEGLTGRIELGNKELYNAKYDIMNLQKDRNGELTFHKVGKWKIQKNQTLLHIDGNKIHWKGYKKSGIVPKSTCSDPCRPGTYQTDVVACCWLCIKCPVETISTGYNSKNCTQCPEGQHMNDNQSDCVEHPAVFVSWSDPVGIAYTILAILGILAVVFVTVVFIRHNSTPVVKGSQRWLSYSLLWGIAWYFGFIFNLLSKPSNFSCRLQPPWVYIIFTFCVCVLLIKTVRITTIFNMRQTGKTSQSLVARILSSTRGQLVLLFSLLFFQIFCLGLWFYFDLPNAGLVHDETHITYLMCHPVHTPLGSTVRHLMFSYLTIVSVVCAVFAFRARKLPQNFNEAKYIAFCMYIQLLTWVLFYPVYTNVKGTFITIFTCGTTWVGALGMLGCIFFPKMYIILRHPERNTPEFVKAEITTRSFFKEKLRKLSKTNLKKTSAVSGMFCNEGFTTESTKNAEKDENDQRKMSTISSAEEAQEVRENGRQINTSSKENTGKITHEDKQVSIIKETKPFSIISFPVEETVVKEMNTNAHGTKNNEWKETVVKGDKEIQIVRERKTASARSFPTSENVIENIQKNRPQSRCSFQGAMHVESRTPGSLNSRVRTLGISHNELDRLRKSRV